MCGINGIFSKNPSDLDNDINIMNEAIRHRGPDDDGVFTDKHCALGMRRLSIIDLAEGKQPIYNEDRRFVIVSNGEI
ncbi:MAG: asparagine synthetase B, partial [Candidatus Pacebacteria bacterium]|nr:asparagine synthetase B [Candidatus Paceibacterota bacterium]